VSRARRARGSRGRRSAGARPARSDATRRAGTGRRALGQTLAARAPATPARWNADPEEVQRAVAKLVLTLVEFLRKLFERQALRRMEARTLTPAQIEAVGLALMRLEETIQDLAKRFDLRPEDLDLDLGPLGRLT
jgi:hypothetical protein